MSFARFVFIPLNNHVNGLQLIFVVKWARVLISPREFLLGQGGGRLHYADQWLI